MEKPEPAKAGDTFLSGQTLAPTPWARVVLLLLTWGCATLHPRLYAIACFAG
jgi:hypothetical protein